MEEKLISRISVAQQITKVKNKKKKKKYKKKGKK
jgi:hypothetical protein